MVSVESVVSVSIVACDVVICSSVCVTGCSVLLVSAEVEMPVTNGFVASFSLFLLVLCAVDDKSEVTFCSLEKLVSSAVKIACRVDIDSVFETVKIEVEGFVVSPSFVEVFNSVLEV